MWGCLRACMRARVCLCVFVFIVNAIDCVNNRLSLKTYIFELTKVNKATNHKLLGYSTNHL